MRCVAMRVAFKAWNNKNGENRVGYSVNKCIWKTLGSLSLALSRGWHFCLDDFNKLLHTKLNKVRRGAAAAAAAGKFANYNYSIPGPKGKFALHSKRDSGNGSGSGYVSGRIKRFTSCSKLQTATQSAQQRGWQNGSSSAERAREREGGGRRGKLTGRSTGQTSITA